MLRLSRLVLSVFWGFAALLAFPAALHAQTPPRPYIGMWVGPPRADTTMLNATSPSLWPESYSGMSTYLTYYVDLNAYKTTAAQAFLSKLRADGKAIAVEVGAFYTGAICQNQNLPDPALYDQATLLPKLAAYGAKLEGDAIAASLGTSVDYIVIDGAFERIFDRQSFANNCQAMNSKVNLEYAASELGKYVVLMRQRFPNAKFILGTNFAHWNFTPPGGVQIASTTSHGPNINDINPVNGSVRNLDYRDVLSAAKSAASAAGVPLHGTSIDTPYNYITDVISGDAPTGSPAGSSTVEARWARIAGLVSQGRTLGLKTALITNSEQFAASGGTSQKFHQGSVAYSAAATSRNIPLDMHFAQSWYQNIPTEIPRESVQYSMTAAARDIWFGLRAYNEPNFGVIGYIDGVVGASTLNGWACAKYNAKSIYVHLYAGGPAGQGTYAGYTLANLTSEAAVGTACKTSFTKYRFAIPVANRFPVGTALYVYGISPVGGTNNLLTGSGMFVSP